MKFYTRIRARLNSMQGDGGATTVEYGLLISLIAAFIMGVVGALGIAIDAVFNEAAGAL
jgi:pilus assembly protein Flp/PilA